MARKRRRTSNLKSVDADIDFVEALKDAPEMATPQTEAPAYRLAFVDQEFMRRDELRAVRLQLELLKPEMILEAHGVASTVILFGGARVPAKGAKPTAQTETARQSLTALSKYYDMARRFAHLASLESLRHSGREFVVATGGGPGVMEAGNRGAQEAGASSIGFNIVLPREPTPNAYVSPEYCFNFHYFAIRKMHFLMRAKAVAIFPGGFGTLDELFETLTLIQTERMERMPILLFGPDFWRSIVNFEALRDAGTISPDDLELFQFVDDADEAWDVIRGAYDLDPIEA